MKFIKTVTEAEYWEHPAISQSDLKLLLQSPRMYKAKKDGKLPPKESSGFRLGSLFDIKVLTPDVFDSLYVERPEKIIAPSSAQEKAFCQSILLGAPPIVAYNDHYKTDKKADDKILQEAEAKVEKFDDYLNYMASVDGREEFSYEDARKLTQMRLNLEVHPEANRLLIDRGREDTHRTFQMGIIFEIAGFEGKSLIDAVLFEDQVVYNTDLKTTGKPLSEFPYSYRKYGYDFQQMWCKLALIAYLRHYEQKVSIRDRLVVVETCGLHECKVYKPDPNEEPMVQARIKDALRRLRWHQETNRWDHTWEEYENEYTLTIGPR
jgi:hypothetical protein